MEVNIVIVDDTPDNLRILIQLLGDQGYEVRAFSEGSFALEAARRWPPDLILLDIRMPGMDGYQVCEQLKADPRTCDIPVIFLSALGEVQDKVKGFEVGAVDYITKPFQAQEVLARVTTQIALRQFQQGLQQEIVRRTHAEEQLRELNQQLQEANASKDKFFSIIAHDLRAPFTGLLGLTGTLVEEFDTYSEDHIKKIIRLLHDSSEKVYTLLENLLTWSRLQRGLIKQVPKDIPMTRIVGGIVRLFASHAEQKQVLIKSVVPQDTTTYADYNMLNTILRNLISNALKFTEAQGVIEVSATSVDDAVEIAVSDTGIGMSAEQQAKLFRIDSKSSTPGTAGEEGTGLGLMLCKELIEKNGGTIRVESEVGKGTTFFFTIPKKRANTKN